MAVTGKSGKHDGRKPNRFRPFPKRGGGMQQPPMPFLPPPPWQVRQPKSSDDRHVMAKHASLYPANLPAFQKMVSACEKALKLVSDQLSSTSSPTDEDSHTRDEEEGQATSSSSTTPLTTGEDTAVEENSSENPEEAGSSTKTKKNDSTSNKDQQKKEQTRKDLQRGQDNVYRSLKGVQRVGVFGHGLLLQDDLVVDLVALSDKKPTETLLQQIYECFPTHLSAVTDDKYDVELQMESAAMYVTREKEPKIACRITLTSPQMRVNFHNPEEVGSSSGGDNNNGDHKNISGSNGDEEKDMEIAGEEEEKKTVNEEETTDSDIDPPDVLNKEICLEALAKLRRAKWFQAQARGLPNCVVVLRILRDLSKRVPEWEKLTLWSMELLVQKCIASVRVALGPGNALRRVFECLSVGIILPLGNGLYDPCEREPTDPLTGLSVQDRETITASAQHMLRLMAFRRIRKVLDMEPLPTPRRKYKQRKRKRGSDGVDSSEPNQIEKKDKKDEVAEEEDAVAEDEEDELLELEEDEDCVTTDA